MKLNKYKTKFKRKKIVNIIKYKPTTSKQSKRLPDQEMATDDDDEKNINNEKIVVWTKTKADNLLSQFVFDPCENCARGNLKEKN